MTVRYWLTGTEAQPPRRNKGAALDLYVRLTGRSWRLVWGWAKLPTGVALEMPDNVIVRITGRSGAFLRGFIVHDGLIESEFNGRELMVLVFCPWPRLVRHGERIAQMWGLSIERDLFALVEAPLAVGPAKRGFGSTGH
jgi:dUTPase